MKPIVKISWRTIDKGMPFCDLPSEDSILVLKKDEIRWRCVCETYSGIGTGYPFSKLVESWGIEMIDAEYPGSFDKVAASAQDLLDGKLPFDGSSRRGPRHILTIYYEDGTRKRLDDAPSSFLKTLQENIKDFLPDRLAGAVFNNDSEEKG